MAKVHKSTDSSSLAEVVDRILDKGIVVDAWVKVSLVGIELLSVEALVFDGEFYPKNYTFNNQYNRTFYVTIPTNYTSILSISINLTQQNNTDISSFENTTDEWSWDGSNGNSYCLAQSGVSCFGTSNGVSSTTDGDWFSSVIELRL